jgi:choline kinase
VNGDLAVVVLAAGRGSRLASTGRDVPKWLLPVNGTPIAHVHLAALRAASASWSRLVAVVGHRSEALDERELSALAGRPCELVHNSDYASANNWLSLALALDHLHTTGWRGGVCVLNSDLLLPPERLRAILALSAEGAHASLLAADMQRPPSDEAMKVVVGDDGRSVADIGKGALRGAPSGEYIGLSVLAPDHVPVLRRVLTSFRHDPRRRDEWYEAAYREAIDAGLRFHAAEVGTDEWVEIDDERDLATATALGARHAW